MSDSDQKKNIDGVLQKNGIKIHQSKNKEHIGRREVLENRENQ